MPLPNPKMSSIDAVVNFFTFVVAPLREVFLTLAVLVSSFFSALVTLFLDERILRTSSKVNARLSFFSVSSELTA